MNSSGSGATVARGGAGMTALDASAADIPTVLAALETSEHGLSAAEAAERERTVGRNLLGRHRAHPLVILGRQLTSPILLLLVAAAVLSAFFGETLSAAVIIVILVASTTLGFVNEYRGERAADALHDRVRHHCLVRRDGDIVALDVVDVVPGDIVRLTVGSVVPADLRLIDTVDLRCDESVLTGESTPAPKSTDVARVGADIAGATSSAFMGTIVQSGLGTGVVVATGASTEFGRIAVGLATAPPVTGFQRGLARFSLFLLEIAAVLTSLILVANLLLGRPLLDSALFALAIAVGITPQLLPAIVSTSLAAGSRSLLARGVVVKRLVCIEDLGNIDTLVTDKTGTLTTGAIQFIEATPVGGFVDEAELVRLALFATDHDFDRASDDAALDTLDAALWAAPVAVGFDGGGLRRIDLLPFDHERRLVSALIDGGRGGRRIIVKGSPDDVVRRCRTQESAELDVLARLSATGRRVVAVASRDVAPDVGLDRSQESDLTLLGFIGFADPPKSDAQAALDALAALGISVRVATGDSSTVAQHLMTELGQPVEGVLDGAGVDALDDAALAERVAGTTIFARVSPEQKARIVRSMRSLGRSVAFLGDGVNDALALHAADIGISVDSAADVAKDAADAILLEKDLAVLAAGVAEGRRVFANTIKYVLMGTSSNFGNMFSAAIASLMLPFLPLLPGQILVNNLLYDVGQLAIPGDRVDPEQVRRPAHWDIAFIRRFMLVFGPISSLFDFATFGLMLLVFHANEGQFQAGWFVESIATQSLIIFAIRTRRVPFFRSRPSTGLTVATVGVVTVGVTLPFTPVGPLLGFSVIGLPFFGALIVLSAIYLVLVEFVKRWFYSRQAPHAVPAASVDVRARRVHRRASRFVQRERRVRRSEILASRRRERPNSG